MLHFYMQFFEQNFVYFMGFFSQKSVFLLHSEVLKTIFKITVYVKIIFFIMPFFFSIIEIANALWIGTPVKSSLT